MDDLTSVQNAASLDRRVTFLAKIVATMKIFPKKVTKDFSSLHESIKKILPKDAYVYKFEEEPIAFGLIALIVHIVMEESVGGEMEKVEEALRTIDDIDAVEVVLVRRI